MNIGPLQANGPAGPGIAIKALTKEDMATFLELIAALADYEHLAPPDAAARQRLETDALADPPRYRALLAQKNEVIIGYAVYFFTYSTFLARPTMYLEDIFVLPEERGNGVGKALMTTLAQEATRVGCGRMEWQVLDWNTPSQEFYEKVGARPLAEWRPYRITEEAILRLANGITPGCQDNPTGDQET